MTLADLVNANAVLRRVGSILSMSRDQRNPVPSQSVQCREREREREREEKVTLSYRNKVGGIEGSIPGSITRRAKLLNVSQGDMLQTRFVPAPLRSARCAKFNSWRSPSTVTPAAGRYQGDNALNLSWEGC